MCRLHDVLSMRAAVMLPGESFSLTRESLQALLAQAEHGQLATSPSAALLSGATRGTGGPSSALPSMASWTTEALAMQLGVAASSFRSVIARGVLGPPDQFRQRGARGYRIPGGTAEAIHRHLQAGGSLANLLTISPSSGSPRIEEEMAVVERAYNDSSNERSSNALDAARTTERSAEPAVRAEQRVRNKQAKHSARKASATPAVVRIDSWRGVFESKSEPARRKLG